MHRTPHPYLRGELVVVIDCTDLGRAAEFWTGVLSYVAEYPGSLQRLSSGQSGPPLIFENGFCRRCASGGGGKSQSGQKATCPHANPAVSGGM